MTRPAGTWSTTGSLGAGRVLHTATLLPSGKVLAAGGYNYTTGTHLQSAELYRPDRRELERHRQPRHAARDAHTATLLPDGTLLVAGGYDDSSGSLASAERYDPTAGTWSATGSLAVARDGHTATLLPDASVLVAGGYNDSNGYLAGAELYDRNSGTWSATGTLAPRARRTARRCCPPAPSWSPAATTLPAISASAELYDPATATWTAGR